MHESERERRVGGISILAVVVGVVRRRESNPYLLDADVVVRDREHGDAVGARRRVVGRHRPDDARELLLQQDERLLRVLERALVPPELRERRVRRVISSSSIISSSSSSIISSSISISSIGSISSITAARSSPARAPHMR